MVGIPRFHTWYVAGMSWLEFPKDSRSIPIIILPDVEVVTQFFNYPNSMERISH